MTVTPLDLRRMHMERYQLPAQPLTVDPHPTLTHVLRLVRSGYTPEEIAAAADVPLPPIKRMATGERTRLSRERAERVRALRPKAGVPCRP